MLRQSLKKFERNKGYKTDSFKWIWYSRPLKINSIIALNSMSDALIQQIARGAQKLNIALTEQQLQQLGAYLQLMIKWNKAYNLTAIREPEQMVKLHLLDSLAVYPYLKDAEIYPDIKHSDHCPVYVEIEDIFWHE